jgi:hypothetical protein
MAKDFGDFMSAGKQSAQTLITAAIPTRPGSSDRSIARPWRRAAMRRADVGEPYRTSVWWATPRREMATETSYGGQALR